MRKITEQATRAFNNYEPFKKDNTQVVISYSQENGQAYKAELFLFNNLIAIMDCYQHTLYITQAGYETNTTRERLNGIIARFGFSLHVVKGVTYLTVKESRDSARYRSYVVLPNQFINIIGLYNASVHHAYKWFSYSEAIKKAETLSGDSYL